MDAVGSSGGLGGKTVPCSLNGWSTRSEGKGPNSSEPFDGAGPAGSLINRQPKCTSSPVCAHSSMVLPHT
eukprot:2592149-Alexandrium_andersonii.AAC.1